MKEDENNKVIKFPQPKQILNWLRTLPHGGKLRLVSINRDPLPEKVDSDGSE